MKIAIFGAGGVGGYFGARLAAGGADVHLVARGSHLRALRDVGLRVRSVNGDMDVELPAVEDPSAIGPCDVVLFCVKATDTLAAAETLSPLITTGTAVVTLQNGVDNEEKIAEVIGPSHTVGGVAYILATIAEPGVIAHEGSLARMIFGELDGSASDRLKALLAICGDAGIDAELSLDIRVALWTKYAMICATAGMTAAVRLPLGEIRASPAALVLYRRILEEVVAVAGAEGVALAETTVDTIMERLASFPGEWTSSLHYDLTHAKPMELDTLHGTVVARAASHGIPVPVCEAIYGVLEPWAIRNLAAK